MTAVLLEIFRHNLWANERLLDALTALPDERLDDVVKGTYGSPRDTIQHLLSAEQRYIFRLTGEELPDPLRGDDPFPVIDALRRQARRSGERLVEIAESVGPDDTVRLTLFDQRDYEVRKAMLLVQAVNHSTEHRAHIGTTITAHGADPVELDGWGWGEATGAIRPVD